MLGYTSKFQIFQSRRTPTLVVTSPIYPETPRTISSTRKNDAPYLHDLWFQKRFVAGAHFIYVSYNQTTEVWNRLRRTRFLTHFFSHLFGPQICRKRCRKWLKCWLKSPRPMKAVDRWTSRSLLGLVDRGSSLSHGENAGGPLITNPMYTLYHVGICWVYPRLKGSLGR